MAKSPATVPVDATAKAKALDLAMKQIEKNHGKGAVMKMGDAPPVQLDAISTGSLTLDHALGIGGVPRGRIIEIYGPESSGKTTLATQIVAEAQKMGGTCAFIDAEHAFDPTYAEKLGVNTDDLLMSQPDTGEQALEICDMLVRSGGLDVVVVDSGRRARAQGRDRGRDGGQPRRHPGAADEPGAPQADRHHQADATRS